MDNCQTEAKSTEANQDISFYEKGLSRNLLLSLKSEQAASLYKVLLIAAAISFCVYRITDTINRDLAQPQISRLTFDINSKDSIQIDSKSPSSIMRMTPATKALKIDSVGISIFIKP